MILFLSRFALRLLFSRLVLRRLVRRYRPSTLALLGLAVSLAVAAIRRRSLRSEVRRHLAAHMRAVTGAK